MDDEHTTLVGYDPTGETADPNASTIVWTKFTRLHGIWVDYKAGPVRPKADAISIWLRGRSAKAEGLAYKADFDNFEMRQVDESVPTR